MKKNIKKINNLDELAVIIQKGFENQDKKIEDRFEKQSKEINIRFENQDKKIEDRFESQEKKTDVKFENLAIMIQKGFEEMATKRDINDLKSEIITLQHDFEELKLRISKLEIIPIEFNFKIQDFEKRIKRIEAELRLK